MSKAQEDALRYLFSSAAKRPTPSPRPSVSQIATTTGSGIKVPDAGSGVSEESESRGFLNNPLIKGIIDGLSVGSYATANMADNFQDARESGNPLDYLKAIPVGAVEGVQGGFGNDEKTKTFSEVIEREQKYHGFDSENKAAKVIQGVGGFAGDVLLDPLTYLSFGVGKAGVSAIRAGMKSGTSEGSYTKEFVNFMKDKENSIRLTSGESLRFDKIRPGARSAKLAKYEKTFTDSSGLMPRHEFARSRGEAMSSGFSVGLHSHRLSERNRKLTKRFNSNLKVANTAFDALKGSAAMLPTGEVKKQSMDIAKMYQKASGESDDKLLAINAYEIEGMVTGRKGSVSTPKAIEQLDPTVALPTVAKAPEPPQGAAGRESPADVADSSAVKADAVAVVNTDPILTKESLYREIEKSKAVKIAETLSSIRIGSRSLDGKSYSSYSKQTIDKLEELRGTAKQVTGKSGDLSILIKVFPPNASPTSLASKYKAEMANTGKISPELEKQIKHSIGQIAIQPGQFGNAAKAAIKEYKGSSAASSRLNIDRDKLDELGIHDSDIDLVLGGGALSVFGGMDSSSLQAIAKELRMLAGVRGGSKKGFDPDHPLWETYEELSGLLGTESISATAKAVENLAKYPEFKYAQDFTSAGGRERVAGAYHGLSGKDGEYLSLINVSDENIRKTIEGERIVTEQLLADLPDEIFTKLVPDLDNIFADFLKVQTTKVGSKTTKRTKASTEGENTSARINQDINTQALLKPYNEILKNSLYSKNFKQKFGMEPTLELKDQVLMASMKYFDTKMIEEGLDFQLSHMAPILKRGEENSSFMRETTVRLGMSDILDSMGKNARIKYVLSGALLPSQVADFGEMLIRSATRLTPQGNIDKAFLRSQVLLTLQGTFNPTGRGKLFDNITNLEVQFDPQKGMPLNASVWNREIKNNLDDNVRKHNIDSALKKIGVDKEVIQSIKEARNKKGKINSDEALNLAKATLGDIDDILPSALDNALAEAIPNSFSKLIESMLVVGADDVSGLSKLIRANMTNTALAAKKVSDRAADNAIETMKAIGDAMKNGSSGDAIEAIKARKAAINSADLPSDAAIATAKTIDQQLTEVIHPDALKNIDEMSKSGSPVERNARFFEQSAKQADELIDDTVQAGKIAEPEDAINDLNAMQETLELSSIRENNGFMATAMGAIAGAFSPRYGLHASYNVLKESDHAFTRIQSAFHAVMNDWSSPRRLREGKVQITNDLLRDSIIPNIQRTIQQGGKIVPDSVESEVYQVISQLFDSSNWSYFDRINMNPKYVELYNRNVANAFGGKTDHLAIKKVATGKKNAQGKMIYKYPEVDQISKMWEHWDFKNPFAFISNMLHAQTKTAQQVGMASAYTKNFGSKIQEPGTYKIPDDYIVKYKFAQLVDKDLFYPKELILNIPQADKILQPKEGITNSKALDNIIQNYADPVISALKFGMTSLKPGHHVMSLQGDIFRNSLATNSLMTREYKEMAGVLTAFIRRNAGTNAVDEFTRSLGNLKGVDVAEGFKDGSTIRLNLRGKPAELSMDEVMELMDFHGISMSKHTGGIQEDFLTGDFVRSNTKVKNAVEKLTTNRAVGWVNNVSAMRDTYSRGALFLKFMRSKRFNSVEEAARFAAMEVKKWAPVGQDLANWESKVARRVFFYYTWIRGMTPRVLESLMTRPGMSTGTSKAMYNIAVANGLDPTSFGDPFDPEMKDMLPSYLRERVIGPSFQSEDEERMGINPVHPTMDILNSWGSGITPLDMANGGWAKKIGDTLVGMSTPWIKAPEELRRMETIDNGIPIDSRFQYLQDLIGPARTVSRITGKTAQPYVDENGLGFLDRTETKYRNGEEGLLTSDSTDSAGQDGFNWLTGSQLTNYDAPNLAKSAQFEQMDEEKAIRLAEERRR